METTSEGCFASVGIGIVSPALPQVRIIHETDPEKYFPALFQLANQHRIAIVGAHRYSVVKEWIRAWRDERKSLRANTLLALNAFSLRLRIAMIRDEVIILGFAPWDWRMAIYAMLARKNAIIYHTSWPYWEECSTPRQYGLVTGFLRRIWLRLLRRSNVAIVAVTDASRNELASRYGLGAQVIPHAVPEAFFAARQKSSRHPRDVVKLIYVGGLWRKKGVELLFELMESLADEPVELTIVGDGTLRQRCVEGAAKNPAIRFLGPINDRTELADTMAAHDILVSLSQREDRWEELFGIVIAEAMAAGLGVVASDHIGPRSLLGGTDFGALFEDGDINGPTELIRQLASARAELDRFRAAHSHLADEFHLDAVSNRWAELITAIAADTYVPKADRRGR